MPSKLDTFLSDGTILVLAPHTDDAELGCGGTISKLKNKGRQIHVAVFSTAEDSLPEGCPPDTLEREFHEAMDVIDIPNSQRHVYNYPVRKLNYHRQEVLEKLVMLRKEIQPDVVFAPAKTDLHQDHQVLFAEGIRAFKTATFLGYELPWNHIEFSAQAFCELEEKHLAKKWEVLEQYKTQVRLARPYFQEKFIRGLAGTRGVQINCDYAEAFEIYRLRF